VDRNRKRIKKGRQTFNLSGVYNPRTNRNTMKKFYGLHTTTKVQRNMMMYERPRTLIDVDPTGMVQFPQIIWDQDYDRYYEFKIDPFIETLKFFDTLAPDQDFDYRDTAIWKEFSYKGEPQMIRIYQLRANYEDIKKNGVKRPICIEKTGERFDGSYRTMMAIHLGIPSIKAEEFRFDWRDMNEEYLRRKVKAHQLAFGTDYYQFEYKPGFWNVVEGGGVYQENAKDRWDVLKKELSLQFETVLDLGCNEGYMAVQCALGGATVYAYEYDQKRIPNAWLNKLIFEWVHQKDLDIDFRCEDFTESNFPRASIILALNVLYHIHDRQKQKDLLTRLSGKIVVQCNLRKQAERENYYGSHPDDMQQLLLETGWVIKKIIDWRDKPIIIATK
jgi:2-polyprenyl-3-methyl-5-hydroxy-6-metoxy-1,4-benzoquinol methylase